MENKYSQILLNNASKLDAVTGGAGSITQCALEITTKGTLVATVDLCKKISDVSSLGDKQITHMAVILKDTLLRYHGYQRIIEICNTDSTEVTPESENPEQTLKELLLELNQLVGLEKVKAKVRDLMAFQKIQRLRRASGLYLTCSTLHLAFIGNPGTGKTTVARIIGRIYKHLGLLTKGHFIEVSRTDLIAGYQGQTALKVKGVIDKSIGGVLFIDEAYSITENDQTDSYGRECLTELTKALEDYRDNLVVIVAGYTEPMRKFFDSNPGLKSRFNTFIDFDDYDTNEMEEILKIMCTKTDYTLSISALDKINLIFNKSVNLKNREFSNGRFVRNIYDDLIMNHAKRISNIAKPSLHELKEITVIDVETLSLNV